MLEQLREEVCRANKSLEKFNLAIFSEGNVSAISEDRKYVVIKPSGASYGKMVAEDMVVLDLKGNVVEGKLKPSTDAPTHLEIYRKFKKINSIVHTHSPYATIFAQLNEEIPCLGTTHADCFYGNIPVTRDLKEGEVAGEYELNTGKIICETIRENVPAVLVARHGPFVFGETVQEAVNNSVVLEKVAMMALHSREAGNISKFLLDRHYFRKHGKGRYYGQS
ncbi:L-fuculose phosphate aldolase [uncultured archaeon]|nr:L-fuculose phosphate aldolase [uncultured archaeon]